jgi:hypothetical protein
VGEEEDAVDSFLLLPCLSDEYDSSEFHLCTFCEFRPAAPRHSGLENRAGPVAWIALITGAAAKEGNQPKPFFSHPVTISRSVALISKSISSLKQTREL